MNWQSKSSTPPPGYSYGDRYRVSLLNALRGIAYILRGRPRSLAHDALYAYADVPLPPLVRGLDRIPESGPFIVVANHYERPGLWMAWPALFISRAVQDRTGRDVHWLAIEEWESFSLFGVQIPPHLIRTVFRRTFHTYGILAVPPPDTAASVRAGALREAAHAARAGEIIGLMPEGTVGATPELLQARAGVGAFLLLLATRAPILPVGLFEEGGRLVAQIGGPFSLEVPHDVAKVDRDGWVRDRVMRAIRDLLPLPLWGAYRDSSA